MNQVERAIEIDPKYEKAHYRQVQILRELGFFEQAMNCVPHWASNKEIQQLQQ